MAVGVKFEVFSEHLAEKVHDLNADLLKVYLTNNTPSASLDALLADLAGLAGGNGYTAGGHDIQNATSRVGGVLSVTAVDVVITATGGPVGPFRYAVIYNDTPTAPADPLIGYYDYGSSITLQDTESFTVDFGSSLLDLS